MLGGGLGGGGLATLGQLKSAFDVSIAARQIAITAAGRVILRIDVLRHDRLMHALLLGRATGKRSTSHAVFLKAETPMSIIRLQNRAAVSKASRFPRSSA